MRGERFHRDSGHVIRTIQSDDTSIWQSIGEERSQTPGPAAGVDDDFVAGELEGR